RADGASTTTLDGQAGGIPGRGVRESAPRRTRERTTAATTAQRARRTRIRSHLLQRWAAANDRPRTRGEQQALPPPYRWSEPRDRDAEAVRGRNAEGVGSVVEVAAICASGAAGHPGGRHYRSASHRR